MFVTYLYTFLNDKKMTQIWKFSESNQDLLKRVVEASKENGGNKWVKKLGHNTKKLLDAYNLAELKEEIIIVINSNSNSSSTLILDDVQTNDAPDADTNQFSQDITMTDPVTNIDYMKKKCLQDPRYYDLLASKMTESNIKKLLDHILNSKIDTNFAERMFTTLLPNYLKKETSRHSLDLLLNMRHHNIFNNLLPIIFNDINIQSIIMQEYTSNLNNREKSELMNNIISFNISNEVFMHHINTILTIYKNCDKSKEINAFILTKLIQAAHNGTADHIYGSLLHLYLQHQRNNPTEALASIDTLGELINAHHSSFRRPCMNVFNNIKNQMDF